MESQGGRLISKHLLYKITNWAEQIFYPNISSSNLSDNVPSNSPVLKSASQLIQKVAVDAETLENATLIL